LSLFSNSTVLLGNPLATLTLETLPVKELELIKLSTWEWFLLLFIVMLITWLLILYQVRSVSNENDQIQSHGEHGLNAHE
jgi:hypothetical protein